MDKLLKSPNGPNIISAGIEVVAVLNAIKEVKYPSVAILILGGPPIPLLHLH